MRQMFVRSVAVVLTASTVLAACTINAIAPNEETTTNDVYPYLNDYDREDEIVVNGLRLRFAAGMNEVRKLYWVAVVGEATRALSATPHVLEELSGLPVYVGPKRRDLPGECDSIVLGGCAFKNKAGAILGIYLVDDDLERVNDPNQWPQYGLYDVRVTLHELGHIHSWLNGRLERFRAAVDGTRYPLPDQYGRRSRSEEYAQLFMFWALDPRIVLQWEGIGGPRTVFFSAEFQTPPSEPAPTETPEL